MAKKSCIITPEAKDGKPSKLYKALLKETANRLQTNLIYAAYIADPNIAKAMDAKGYEQSSQGEHKVADVLDFFDYAKWKDNSSKLSQLEIQYGIKDTNIKPIKYSSAEDALKNADKFNNDIKGYRAIVVTHTDSNNLPSYNIIVREADVNTLDYKNIVEEHLRVWDVYKQVLAPLGVDFNNVPGELRNIISPMNNDIAQYLINIKDYTNMSSLFKRDAMLVFYLNQNSTEVQRVINHFGSIENAAQAINDFNMKIKNLTNGEKRLLVNAFNKGKLFNGIDLKALKKQVDQLSQQINMTGQEKSIKDTLHKLNKKYHINKDEINATNKRITTLRQAVIESIYNIERRIREVKEKTNDTDELVRLYDIQDQLQYDLNSRKYYLGIMEFLREANNQVLKVDDMFRTLSTYGNGLEDMIAKSKVLYNVSNTIKRYYQLIDAIASENTEVEESLATDDIKTFRNLAKDIKKYLDKKQQVFSQMSEEVMQGLMLKILDKSSKTNEAINAIKTASADSSLLSRTIYGMARSNNSMITAIGSIINRAKVGRNDLINKFDERITKATNKLYKSGSNTEFMYEGNGYIISDIDWNKYNTAYYTLKNILRKSDDSPAKQEQKLKEWLDANTEDRVVDQTTGRTEKVPNSKYRKAFPKLTAAQQEYYDTVMQIKGEIGSLLPTYAQHQYVPAQIRRNTVDALTHAKGISDVYDALKNKVKDIYTIREDDTSFHKNGIIDGEEYSTIHTDDNDTPVKRIPIFFINRVEQKELLKDFSAGLNALAGTAINYDAMSRVEEAVNFMGDYIKELPSKDNRVKADSINTSSSLLVKIAHDFSKNTNTSAIVDGFINSLLYGMRNQAKGQNELAIKLAHSLISYTSFKGLATNLKGMVQNALMGGFQMFIECGAGEYYGYKDFAMALVTLLGNAFTTGEIWDLINNTKNSKAVLLREAFDPEGENFNSKSHKRYYKNGLRRILGHDLSFLGYGAGEYMIHMVDMYSCLYHEKVMLNGKETSLYNALEVVDKGNGAAKLQLKQGVTKLDGSAYTKEDLDQVRKNIKYSNDMCHGDMTAEGKGLIYQHFLGAMAMNFRQWMIETYARRWRAKHFDATIGKDVEGFWRSAIRGLYESFKENKDDNGPLSAMIKLMGNFVDLIVRGRMHWATLDDVQKYNLGRVHAELMMFFMLCGINLALGDPDRERGNWAKRFWMYQVRRSMLDLAAGMPTPYIVSSNLTILNSPMAGLNTLNGLLYMVYGLFNGDLFSTYKQGSHKGENKYIRKASRALLPFIKDYEQMKDLTEKSNLFNVFDMTPKNI